MKTSDLRRLIDRASERKAKSQCTTAILIAYHAELVNDPPQEICRVLGLGESYKHQVRAAMQIPEELEALGFKVVPVAKATNS